MIHSQSDVARLLEAIRRNFEAAQRAMKAPAEAIAKHQFITKKMENIEENRAILIGIIGSERAGKLVAQVLETVASEET